MERKLELKDIAGYLPYRLKIQRFDGVINEVKPFALQGAILNNFKLILRPLSDLYKTITHNGKEIRPIVELARIVVVANWKADGRKALLYTLENEATSEYFFYQGNAFIWIDNDTREEFRIGEQWLLFDYLHELKIDYRGLIDAGLAISVYDLEENPYK